ncbi:unnamed protein product [Gadus morhua 'NCC']
MKVAKEELTQLSFKRRGRETELTSCSKYAARTAKMAVDSDTTVVLAALGRPFSLGMLYDCRNDSLIPGK